jgi:hypothetical protein
MEKTFKFASESVLGRAELPTSELSVHINVKPRLYMPLDISPEITKSAPQFRPKVRGAVIRATGAGGAPGYVTTGANSTGRYPQVRESTAVKM